VEGRIDGLDSGPVVSFVASGRAAGDPAATSISGVVLDNTSQPIAGVTLRVLDTALTARTDGKGLFRIPGAPVGTVKLIVDGSTAERPGSWPDLEFALTTIPGRDNTVNMPIYLLPLDQRNGLAVDETRGGTLTLPEVPGFALEIAPGSVTFPGGSRSGVVSVTVVHNDKVPMVPNFGQQPRLIVTIQPAGARFDPPARLTLPNVEGLAPGAVTEMYSFDHDLGHFVSIGPATVSEDGSAIVSNLGVGVLKAGWHCSGDPAAGGTPEHCADCLKCVGVKCVPDAGAFCHTCRPGTGKACDGEGNCKTGRDLIPKICDQLSIDSTNHRTVQCADDPEEGQPGDCGGVLRVDYTRVIHSCDSVDLKGTQITELLIPDHVCTPPRFRPRQGGEFTIREGNVVSGTSDAYSLCVPAEALPLPYHCTETYTQKQFFDGCTRTVIISFEITRTETGCTTKVTRH
jgi:hypothetical protein